MIDKIGLIGSYADSLLKSGLAYTPQPNCALIKLVLWSIIRCSKTSLGTGRNNKQRPLSSQFSWCDTRNDLDYTRSCRLLYVSEPLDYVFERCRIVFLESGVLEAFTFREGRQLCALLGIYWQATHIFDYERANELDNGLPHTVKKSLLQCS